MRKPFPRTSCTASLLLAVFSSLFTCGSDAGERTASVASPMVATYYLAPDGSNANPGTSSTTPFLTWAKAFRVLNPGDTLIVMEGTYGVDNGIADVRCGGETDDYNTWIPASRCLTSPSYQKCGTATAPITVRAADGQERLAHLTVAGVSSPYGGTWAGLRVLNCAHWEFQGLRVQGGDHPSNLGVSGVVDVWNSDHITLKRLLVHDTNRYTNQHTLRVYKSSDVLVEETEAYNYRAHGFIATQSSRVTFRRNYANCNRYENIQGGYGSFPIGKNCSPATAANPNGTTEVQGAGFAFYPADDSLMENNVAEGTSWGFQILAQTATNGYTDASRNRFYGNIAHANYRNFGITPHAVGITSDIVVRDFVSIAPHDQAFWAYIGPVNNLLIENASFFGKTTLTYSSGIRIDPPPGANDSTFIWKTLVMNHGSSTTPAVTVSNTDFCSMRGAVIHGNTNNGYPGSGGTPSAECATEGISTSDPNANVASGSQVGLGSGQCLVYIPSGNGHLKWAAAWSARSHDIGANVVYRYRGGVLGSAKLWDQTTGAFPCGADAIGTAASHRCANVHTRLNVGTNNCAIP